MTDIVLADIWENGLAIEISLALSGKGMAMLAWAVDANDGFGLGQIVLS